MQKLRWHEMTAPEIEDAVREGRDVIFLPLGSVEMHGPHMLTGCDTYIAEALCLLMARRAGGLVLPPVHYSWPGATRNFAGTIRISQEETTRYIEAIVRSLVEQGFKKILLVSGHGGYRWLGPGFAREFFERTAVPVIFMDVGMFRDGPQLSRVFEGKDGSYREASLLLGALHILGKDGLLDLSGVQEDVAKQPTPSFGRVARYGVIGHDCGTLEQHVAPRKDASRDKGVEYLKLLADRFAQLSSDLDGYLEFLSKKQSRS